MPEQTPLHPQEGELLGYADGELPAWQRWWIRRHLTACWQCRATLADLERTIGECVRYRAALRAGGLPEPPAPWFDIRRRIAQLEAARQEAPQAGRRALLAPAWLTPQRVAVAAVLAAVLWAQVTLLRHNRVPAGAPPDRESPVAKPVPAPPATLPGTLPPVPRTREAPPPQPASAPADRATAADELRVFALLRRLGADLGEPVEVTRREGRVIVGGTGVSPEIERRLAAELASSPRVSLQFSAPAGEPPPPNARGLVSSVQQPETSWFLRGIGQRLGSRAAAEQVLNDLLDTSETLLAHLHALRRLAERFPVEVEAQLNEQERGVLAQLVREHASGAAARAAELEQRALTILVPDSPAAPEAPPDLPPSWQGAAAELLRRARRAESQLATMLEGAAMESSPEALVRQWVAEVIELRAAAEAFAR